MARTDAHLGVVIGLVIALAMFFVFRNSTFGFSLATVGRNPGAARYAGMSVKRHIILSMAIAGAIAGLAGTYEVLGFRYRLFHLFSPGYGFDGIIITFLAGGHPLLVVIAATFLAGLRSGAGIMQRAVGIDVTVIEAIQGLVVIFVAMSLAFRFDRSPWAGVLRRRKQVDAQLKSEKQGKPPP
jgi:simple sugar transport system permease protein